MCLYAMIDQIKNDSLCDLFLECPEMDKRKVQSTLFGPAPVKKTAHVAKAPATTDGRPEWFNVEFWNALPPLERQIHCIAYRELGSSYTVESTQTYLAWIKEGKPTSWDVHTYLESKKKK